VPTALKPKSTNPAAKAEAELCDAFLTLTTRQEVRDFLSDIATPAEVRAFTERWWITRLLDEGKLSYREIAERAGASTTTVTRCARFLREMPYQGYRRVLDRLKEPKS
jgi:TrpR-related protein YerC/YecD